MICQTRVLDIHRLKNINLRQTRVSSGGGGVGAANSDRLRLHGPSAYVYVMCEHGTPMNMHMSVCTHMATHQAPHGIEDVHAYARTYVRRLCAHHSYAQQSIPSDDLCISICYFWIESSSGATTSRPDGLPESPP